MDYDYNRTFIQAMFAGIFISIAGWGYLANPMLGMFLFCIGLLGVVKYKVGLFTGTAGFIKSWKDVLDLLIILAGNVFGCVCFSAFTQFSPIDLQTAAMTIIESRITNGWFEDGMLAVGCGVLMTTAVNFARRNIDFSDWLPLLFAVPAFILCGFPHCIADAFYFFTAYSNIPIVFIPWAAWRYYLSIIVGNFIGCNLYRIYIW